MARWMYQKFLSVVKVFTNARDCGIASCLRMREDCKQPSEKIFIHAGRDGSWQVLQSKQQEIRQIVQNPLGQQLEQL
jgi:hypothetical protein